MTSSLILLLIDAKRQHKQHACSAALLQSRRSKVIEQTYSACSGYTRKPWLTRTSEQVQVLGPGTESLQP